MTLGSRDCDCDNVSDCQLVAQPCLVISHARLTAVQRRSQVKLRPTVIPLCSWHVDVRPVVVWLCPCRRSKPRSSRGTKRRNCHESSPHGWSPVGCSGHNKETTPEPPFIGSPAPPPDTIRRHSRTCSPDWPTHHQFDITKANLVVAAADLLHCCCHSLCCCCCTVLITFSLYVLPPGCTFSFSYSSLLPFFLHIPRHS